MIMIFGRCHGYRRSSQARQTFGTLQAHDSNWECSPGRPGRQVAW
jgi:hypothetical protein